MNILNNAISKMEVENLRKKLIFRSWHRGTREIDLLLGRFADEYIPFFKEDELQQYEDLLKNSDPDIYNWISGKEKPLANVETKVLTKLIEYYS